MKKLKSGLFQRGISIAKLTAQSGFLAAGAALSPKEREAYLIKQMQILANELGQLKGSLMKVGQTLSMYGEHFLPPKANKYLKALQYETANLEWTEIQKILINDLGEEKLKRLQIEPKAIAAASLGQVHKAIDKKSGRHLAIKIQYPGVNKAIKSDLKAMKTILSLSRVLPSGPKTDQFFEEIETMLIQETNYKLEKLWTQQVYEKLKKDPRFIVPEIIEDYCSKQILTTTFEDGLKVDSQEVLSLSQSRKNLLAKNYLDLYFQELFVFKMVQTDPHLGNYKVRLNENGTDQIILYDFGAMREVPDHFGLPFRNLVQGAATQDKDLILDSAYKLSYLYPQDSEELKERFHKVCQMIGEPFAEDSKNQFTDDQGNYDWKNTDLPKRVSKAAKDIYKHHKLRVPPRESVFLDRKLGGAFIFVSVLGFKGKAMPLLKKYFDTSSEQ